MLFIFFPGLILATIALLKKIKHLTLHLTFQLQDHDFFRGEVLRCKCSKYGQMTWINL